MSCLGPRCPWLSMDSHSNFLISTLSPSYPPVVLPSHPHQIDCHYPTVTSFHTTHNGLCGPVYFWHYILTHWSLPISALPQLKASSCSFSNPAGSWYTHTSLFSLHTTSLPIFPSLALQSVGPCSNITSQKGFESSAGNSCTFPSLFSLFYNNQYYLMPICLSITTPQTLVSMICNHTVFTKHVWNCSS